MSVKMGHRFSIPLWLIGLTIIFTLIVAGVSPAAMASEPPGKPGNLTAESVAAGIHLTWDAAATGQVATGYQILRRRPLENDTKLQVYVSDTGSTDTDYTDAGVEPGTTYVYRVLGKSDSQTGPRSNFVRLKHTPPAAEQTEGTDEEEKVAATPEGAWASSGAKGVEIEWNDPADDSITGYRVSRRDMSACGSGMEVVKEDTGSADLNWTDSDVEHGGVYKYWIAAINATGTSGDSRPAGKTYSDPGFRSLIGAASVGTPTNLEARPTSGGMFLSWDTPDDESITGYRILRRMPEDCEPSLKIHVADTNRVNGSYLDSDVVLGRIYVYRVLAITGDGFSAQSKFVRSRMKASATAMTVLRTGGPMGRYQERDMLVGIHHLPLDSDDTTLDFTVRADVYVVGRGARNVAVDADMCEGQNMGTDIEFWTIESPHMATEMTFGKVGECRAGEYRIEIVARDSEGERIMSHEFNQTVR